MSRFIRSIKGRVKGLSIGLAVLFAVLCALAEGPQWWTDRGVLIDPDAQPGEYNDFAPVNLGQLKNISKQAYDECIEAGVPETAEHDALVAVLEPWLNEYPPVNYKAANVGQVKHIGSLFHAWLESVGHTNVMTFTSGGNEYAVANVGQVKNIFNFDLDDDDDGLLDFEEILLGTDPNNPDTDGDGYNDWLEVMWGSDPLGQEDVPSLNVYVSPSGGNIYPYNTYEKAANVLQDGLDAVLSGGTVYVDDGTYNTGGRVSNDAEDQLMNRAFVPPNIYLASMHGPENCIIEGAPDPESGSFGNNAVRGVYLSEGAVLDGFTVTNGYTKDYGSTWEDISGGGVIGGSYGNYRGNVINCIITDNHAQEGGGISFVKDVENSIISENSSTTIGGGVSYCPSVENCFVMGNSGEWGGGCAESSLINCTVISNTATVGGGVYGCDVLNSIVYHNEAPAGENWGHYDQESYKHTCTYPLPDGVGNIDDDPKLASLSEPYILSESPCIDAGENQSDMSVLLDLSGEPRIDSSLVDIGCDEFYTAGHDGDLSAAIKVPATTVAVGAELPFVADIKGDPNSYGWDFGDGNAVQGQNTVKHSFDSADNYTVTLTVQNDDREVIDTIIITVVADFTKNVPSTDYPTIQDAINALDENPVFGGVVLVDNGTYGTGTEELRIDNPIIVRSLNGPSATTIQGGAGVNCAYVSDYAVLEGFTLTGGSRGAKCETKGMVLNCRITGNIDYGVEGGAARNCIIDNNTGIAVYKTKLENCTVVKNNSAIEYISAINSIIYDNQNAWDYSSVYHFTCAQYMSPNQHGLGCITVDPELTDIGVNDYTLNLFSPCVDAGKELDWVASGVDQKGNARKINSQVDMGALEFSGDFRIDGNSGDDIAFWKLFSAIQDQPFNGKEGDVVAEIEIPSLINDDTVLNYQKSWWRGLRNASSPRERYYLSSDTNSAGSWTSSGLEFRVQGNDEMTLGVSSDNNSVRLEDLAEIYSNYKDVKVQLVYTGTGDGRIKLDGPVYLLQWAPRIAMDFGDIDGDTHFTVGKGLNKTAQVSVSSGPPNNEEAPGYAEEVGVYSTDADGENIVSFSQHPRPSGAPELELTVAPDHPDSLTVIGENPGKTVVYLSSYYGQDINEAQRYGSKSTWVFGPEIEELPHYITVCDPVANDPQVTTIQGTPNAVDIDSEIKFSLLPYEENGDNLKGNAHVELSSSDEYSTAIGWGILSAGHHVEDLALTAPLDVNTYSLYWGEIGGQIVSDTMPASEQADELIECVYPKEAVIIPYGDSSSKEFTHKYKGPQHDDEYLPVLTDWSVTEGVSIVGESLNQDRIVVSVFGADAAPDETPTPAGSYAVMTDCECSDRYIHVVKVHSVKANDVESLEGDEKTAYVGYTEDGEGDSTTEIKLDATPYPDVAWPSGFPKWTLEYNDGDPSVPEDAQGDSYNGQDNFTYKASAPGKYVFTAKCGDNGNAVRATNYVVKVDLDVDSNNDGTIDNNNSGEDEYESFKPGVIMCIGEDREIKLGMSEGLDSGLFVLRPTECDESLVSLYSEENMNGTRYNWPYVVYLDSGELPQSLYIAGDKRGHAQLSLAYYCDENSSEPTTSDTVSIYISRKISYVPASGKVYVWNPINQPTELGFSLEFLESLEGENTQGWTLDEATYFFDSDSTDDQWDGCTLENLKAMANGGIIVFASHGREGFVEVVRFSSESKAKEWLDPDDDGMLEPDMIIGPEDTDGDDINDRFRIFASYSWFQNNWQTSLTDNNALVFMQACYSCVELEGVQESIASSVGGRTVFGTTTGTDGIAYSAVHGNTLLYMNGRHGDLDNRSAKQAYELSTEGVATAGDLDIYGEGNTTLCPASQDVFPVLDSLPDSGWGCIIFDSFMDHEISSQDAVTVVPPTIGTVGTRSWGGNADGKFFVGFEFAGNGIEMKAYAEKCTGQGRELDGNAEAPNGDSKEWEW